MKKGDALKPLYSPSLPSKPPVVKGKGKLKEAKEEGMNIEKNEQALILRTKKIGEARQGSASPDWMTEPDAEAYQG